MAREHDRENDKERQLRRWQKAQRHLLSRAEELARKQASKAAHAARKHKPRQRSHSDDDGPVTDSPMRPHAPTPGRPAGKRDDAAQLPHGTVTAVHANGIAIDGIPARLGGELVLDPDHRPVVGDEVAYVLTAGPPRAVAVLPRRSLLARTDPGNPHRQLVLAANVDVALIVIAARNPPPKPGLIDRCMLALTRGRIAPAVIANKVDLLDLAGRQELAAMLAPYEELGLPVHRCSAHTGEGLAAMRASVRSRTVVLLGHSGVGKSSVLNALDPDGQRRVRDVREHDGRGRHTTTSSSLRQLADGTRVIDTPGVRAFGLDALEPHTLRAAFAEFLPFAAGCRFTDCTHRHEPDCAVRTAVAAGQLTAARFASWLRILATDEER